jgi:hypothetical protein
MSERAPLVPENVDLRDFAYMPLDVLRLRDSDLAAEATDAEFRAAVMLWCASWHQMPAGSLPDNDAVLTRLSGFGRDIEGWKSVRDGALRGWIKCDDGRLYHSVVAEKANEAWDHKQKQRARTAAARAARLSQSPTPETTDDVTTPVTENVTASKGTERNGTKDTTASAVVGAPRSKRNRPRSQIDPNAQPTEADREAASTSGLDPPAFRSEWQRFRDHHRAKGSVMADWPAAWRTWLSNRKRFNGASNDEKSVHRAFRSLPPSGFDIGPAPPPYMPFGCGDEAGGDSNRLLSERGSSGTGDLSRGSDGGLVLLPRASGLSSDGSKDGSSREEPMASDRGGGQSRLRG